LTRGLRCQRVGQRREAKQEKRKLREDFKEMGGALVLLEAMTGLKAVPCSDFPDPRTMTSFSSFETLENREG